MKISQDCLLMTFKINLDRVVLDFLSFALIICFLLDPSKIFLNLRILSDEDF